MYNDFDGLKNHGNRLLRDYMDRLTLSEISYSYEDMTYLPNRDRIYSYDEMDDLIEYNVRSLSDRVHKKCVFDRETCDWIELDIDHRIPTFYDRNILTNCFDLDMQDVAAHSRMWTSLSAVTYCSLDRRGYI